MSATPKRCSASSLKSKSREAFENDLKKLLVAPAVNDAASLRPPLVPIQELTHQASDPVNQGPKSAPNTPGRLVPRVHGFHSGQGVEAGERSGFSRVCRGLGNLSSAAPLVSVPHFELREDPFFWNDHNVQVLIRIRPLNVTEINAHGHRCLVQESSQDLTWSGQSDARFTFDHVACETLSQEKLFKVVGLPTVENCMSGYNSCMFAYGQTGSGKTYTMMGDIHDMDGAIGEYGGMIPRMFEYLFTRIKQEKEKQNYDNLSYSCKCSFLEIYNEQIADLLEPLSANLQIREDIKKGVYVENLSEYEVLSVHDVLEVLQKGAMNRKMAATRMNSESSRSHCVFTCVIESHWEKDSLHHHRFGRLNLVDLAGSERKKSSGAEGERLKEAANINRSLSTLGLVIMTLVDIENGKSHHIPYRDSKLTFLLQDSLGGNSKTTIIANVSPSICSAYETLSTLKFAQRAKLIKNNAKVNEDASGDVIALQHQIQTLKDHISFLAKLHNIPRSPPSEIYYPPEVSTFYLSKNQREQESRLEELENKLSLLMEENTRLVHLFAAKDAEMDKLSNDWEKATIDLTNFLVDGCKSLDAAHGDIGSFLVSFPQSLPSINEHVERAIRVVFEKETLIANLQNGLEEARRVGTEMKSKLNSLRGATLALMEERENNNCESCEAVFHFLTLMKEKISKTPYSGNSISDMEDKMKREEDWFKSIFAFLNLHDIRLDCSSNKKQNESQINEFADAEMRREESESMLVKLERVQETMEEADLMLNALIEANEFVKEDRNWWRQETDTLLSENSRLIEELDGLRALFLSLEKRCRMLDEYMNSSVVYTREFFRQTLVDIEGVLNDVFSENLNFAKELLDSITTSRCLLQGVISEILKLQLYCSVGYTLKMLKDHVLEDKKIYKEEGISKGILDHHRKQFYHVSCNSNKVQECLEIGQLVLERDRDYLLKRVAHLEKDNLDLIYDIQLLTEAVAKFVMFSDKYTMGVTTGRLDDQEGSIENNNIVNLLHNKSQRNMMDQLDCLSVATESGSHMLNAMKMLQKNIQLLCAMFNEISNSENNKDESYCASDVKQVEEELAINSAELESKLSEKDFELSGARSDLKVVQEAVFALSNENIDVSIFLDDSDDKVIQGSMLSEDERKQLLEEVSTDGHLSYMEDVKDELRRVCRERDYFQYQFVVMSDKFEIASALADEKDAIAVEACQVAEARRIYAEEKEEEVKVLEHSVHELECTVDVLEKKLYELQEEVEGHQSSRRDIELEVRGLSERMLTVENVAESFRNIDQNVDGEYSRQLDEAIIELYEARAHIIELEMEIACKEEEIKQYRNYSNELTLHSEAQSVLYQENFKSLELMVSGINRDQQPSMVAGSGSSMTKREKTPSKTRSSGSPLKCITNMVHQMNCEKSVDLSFARLRIKELEAIATERQKEICLLNTRLASVECMAHDVIRDLLVVKLDMSNYAKLLNEGQIHTFIDKVHQQFQEIDSKEREISQLKENINQFIKERNRLMEEINQRRVDLLATHAKGEGLQERVMLLSAQNEMLKIDKAKMQKKIAELELAMKVLSGVQQCR